MKKFILSEKNLVVILFVFVFIIFSFAQEDTKKIEKIYFESSSSATSYDKPENPEAITPKVEINSVLPAVQVR
ncbi:MAG: hypothetical protein Q8941_01270 [Bacteroidota bacterium]|nr:hypothetical protein [Bacteroidota bacterium]